MIAALESGEPGLTGRALQAAGELGRRELLPLVGRFLSSSDEALRFQAARAAALLGDRGGVEPLMEITAADAPCAVEALRLVAGLLSAEEAGRWLRNLAQRPGAARTAVIAAGKIGDPAWVPWLIDCMRVPELARTAGEAFSGITGADLSAEGLEAEAPEGFDAGPSEDPADEDVALDPDENLGWPDPGRVEIWWRAHAGEYPKGTPLLAGRPITPESCLAVLRRGNQRLRADAALRLALLNPESPLFEVRAPGRRQMQRLSTGCPQSHEPEAADDPR
jgi:uncharacterized protein (TIGR02270 family)